MRPIIKRTISAGALLIALAGVLAACGDDASNVADPGSSSSVSATPSTGEPSSESPAPSTSSSAPPSGPDCTSVWKDGATLARRYAGCVQTDQLVKPDGLGCSSGQRIIRYDEHYYAVPGGRVYHTKSVLEKDRGYRDAVAVCRG